MNFGINYVVLRTHARIADLMTKEQLRHLSEASDIDEFLLRLSETPYGEIDVEHDSKIALNLEKIFTKKFIDRIGEIVKITPTKMGMSPAGKLNSTMKMGRIIISTTVMKSTLPNILPR